MRRYGTLLTSSGHGEAEEEQFVDEEAEDFFDEFLALVEKNKAQAKKTGTLCCNFDGSCLDGKATKIDAGSEDEFEDDFEKFQEGPGDDGVEADTVYYNTGNSQ